MSGKRFVLMKTQSIIAPRNRVRYGILGSYYDNFLSFRLETDLFIMK